MPTVLTAFSCVVAIINFLELFMNRATACVIALLIFIIALVLTIGISSVITEHHIPVTNLGVVMISLIPISLFGMVVAIVVRLFRGGAD